MGQELVMDIPTTEPAELVAGNTWRWDREFADFPAGTWTLEYRFKNATASFAITGSAIVASGTTHQITVPAATTVAFTAGRYQWQAYVTSGSTRYVAADGELVVTPDFAAVGNYDGRSPARKMLDAIETYLADPSNLTAASYQIGNRSLDRMKRTDLLAERTRLQFEVAAEISAAGGPDRRRVFTRFGARG